MGAAVWGPRSDCFCVLRPASKYPLRDSARISVLYCTYLHLCGAVQIEHVTAPCLVRYLAAFVTVISKMLGVVKVNIFNV